jgi:hypothetical protein
MRRDCASALEIARDTSTEEDYEPVEEPYRSLYEGAAAACLAGLDGRSELWDTALERFPAVDTAALDCWNLEIYAIFHQLVGAHRANLRAEISGNSTRSSGCPELTGLDPDHGPRSGGYAITVHGHDLPPFLPLSWLELGVEVHAERRPDGTMTVIVPAVYADVDPSVRIMISDAPRIDAPLYAYFTYDD